MLAKIYIIYCNKFKLNEIWKRVVEFGAYVLINLCWIADHTYKFKFRRIIINKTMFNI